MPFPLLVPERLQLCALGLGQAPAGARVGGQDKPQVGQIAVVGMGGDCSLGKLMQGLVWHNRAGAVAALQRR